MDGAVIVRCEITTNVSIFHMHTAYMHSLPGETTTGCHEGGCCMGDNLHSRQFKGIPP